MMSPSLSVIVMLEWKLLLLTVANFLHRTQRYGITGMKGMKWVFKKDAPLLVNLNPDWQKVSWFAEFIASIPNYKNNTVQTAHMVIEARKHLFALAKQEGIDFYLKREGILHLS
jgi:hypothetical protein